MLHEEIFAMMADIEVVDSYLENLMIDDYTEPDVEINALLKECFRTIVRDLSTNHGIEFYCDESMLLSNFYDAQVIIDIYKHFRPDTILKSYTHDNPVYQSIVAMAQHNEPNVLLKVLEYRSATSELGDHYPTERVNFLADKVKSNATFNSKLLYNAAYRTTDDVDAESYMRLLRLINKQLPGYNKVLIAIIYGNLFNIGKNMVTKLQKSYRSDLLGAKRLATILTVPETFRNPIVLADTTYKLTSNAGTDVEIINAIVSRVSNHYLFNTPLEFENDSLSKIPEYATILDLALTHIPKDSYVINNPAGADPSGTVA